MANELYVTLESSDNDYLKYPCQGWLELFEIGRNGSIIKGVFRSDPYPGDKTPCFSNAPLSPTTRCLSTISTTLNLGTNKKGSFKLPFLFSRSSNL